MNTLLQCEHLTKCYGKKKTALKDLNLSLESGRITGLLGPNGSGKTTFIKLACGLLQPKEGRILIDGRKPGPETKAIISYLPDLEYLPQWMNVGELSGLFQDFYEDYDAERAAGMLDSLKLDPKEKFKKMSKGNKEKVQLVLTMSRKAKLFLLDEPLGGVDPAARESILSTIITSFAWDAAVLISTHLIADVEPILDDVIMIREGQLLSHRSADEIRETEGMSVDQYFREVYKC